MPPSDPVEQGVEGDWDTVGEAAGGSRSRGRTGRRRQYPQRSNRDGGPVKLVSIDPSRVVHWMW
jgi:hypothetical protein